MVTNEETVLFDDVSLSELKSLSVEELLTMCVKNIKYKMFELISTIETVEIKRLSVEIKKSRELKELYIYVAELYRRNALDYTDNSLFLSGHYDGTVNCNLYKANNIKIFLYNCKEIFFGETCFLCKKEVYMKGFYLTPIFSGKHFHIYQFFGNENNVMCNSCKLKHAKISPHYGEIIVIKGNLLPPGNTESGVSGTPISEQLFYERFREIYNNMYNTISYLNYYFENKLQEIQMVKETMLRIMKTPLLTKELEECMDEILDLNGNRISQLKEYLTEEQYRFVRSGAKFDELDGQKDMLVRMNKMLKQLKMTSIGQSIMDLPIARPITPEIKHLERELESQKFRQKNHEKELEKLKCKI
jgi:hypothetical protein